MTKTVAELEKFDPRQVSEDNTKLTAENKRLRQEILDERAGQGELEQERLTKYTIAMIPLLRYGVADSHLDQILHAAQYLVDKQE